RDCLGRAWEVSRRSLLLSCRHQQVRAELATARSDEIGLGAYPRWREACARTRIGFQIPLHPASEPHLAHKFICSTRMTLARQSCDGRQSISPKLEMRGRSWMFRSLKC